MTPTSRAPAVSPLSSPGTSPAPLAALPPSPSRAPDTGAAEAPQGRRVAPADAAIDDAGPVGSAGAVLLSPAWPTATVEIDRSPGARLSIDPRAVIARELKRYGGKRDVNAVGDGTVVRKSVYTSEDLRRISAASRTARSGGERPAIQVLVLEGRYEDDQVTGVAFQATGFAVFPDQIDAPLGLDRAAFETAVVVHELGHLFGLVNLTGQGAFHEDSAHPGHAVSDESVMYWAIEQVSLRNVFRAGPPTEFDAADRAEMRRIRSS